ncbi:MAG: hypothetical protein ACTSRP_03330 [Candidatus Helarchaeota archaeon]
MLGFNGDKINHEKLLLEMLDALVVMLSFYEDLTDKHATPSFISNFDKFLEFTKNYDIAFVYETYNKIKKITMKKKLKF